MCSNMSAQTTDLVARLLADAEETETMRDRYKYRGNDQYPRQFPGPAYAKLDRKARDLRQAAKMLRAQ